MYNLTNCLLIQIGPEVLSAPQSIQDRVKFHRFGIAGEDAPHGHPVMYTLQSLMKQNGKI